MAGQAIPTLSRGRLAEHPLWSRAAGSAEAAAHLLLPVVVSATVEDREAVEGAPGGSRIERLSITELVRDARAAAHAGIGGLLILGAADRKDELALLASERDHIVVRAIRAVKQAVPDLPVATDVCVCSHTAHGQCVLFSGGQADVPATLGRIAEIAVVHADAGADLILPSGMLDGAAAAIRKALDDAGYLDLPVAAMVDIDTSLATLERSAISAVPIRERVVPLIPAPDAAAALARGVREVQRDADALVIRPAGVAADLVALLVRSAGRPVIAYHSADEHGLYAAAAAGDTADAEAAERESIAASRRAGASFVITFGAFAAAEA